MTALTALERTALHAILAEAVVGGGAALQWQLADAKVLSRENTGGGFFTEFTVPTGSRMFADLNQSLGENVRLGIAGLEYGLGMILHFTEASTYLLEGYAVGDENTSATDFTNVEFALIR